MKKRLLPWVLPLLFTALLLGCEKDEKNYRLDLTVTVQDSIKAQNALVHIYAPVENSFVDFFVYTDENGRASIKLKNKAVVEIVATKAPYKGCTFGEIDRDGTSVSLDMKLYNDENNGCRGNQ